MLRMNALLTMMSLIAAPAVAACGGGDGTPAADTADTTEAVDTAPPVDTATAADTADADVEGRLCTPGALFCTSASVSGVCNADGSGASTVTPCHGATACEPSTGICRATICAPDKQSCLDLDRYQVCNGDGSGWGDIETCPEGEFCADGKCRVCQSERVECLSQTTFRVCAANSSGWSDELDCPDDNWCVRQACTPCDLTTECIGTSKMRRYCASGEVDFDVTESCPAGQQCENGSCFACEPDRVECRSDTTFRKCDGQGQAWGEDTACGDGEICLDARCIAYACVPRVLFVVDRSGSMGSHWDTVKESIRALATGNPKIRFGLTAFPNGGFSCEVDGSVLVPFAQHNAAALNDWFEANGPTGATPLAGAMSNVLAHADEIFGGLGGSVIVLSDGEDTCFSGSSLALKADLATSAGQLWVDHQVQTFAIGYSFGGDPEELDTLTNNGGSGFTGHFPAGDEQELLEALTAIVDVIKVCDQAPPGG
ncbi:MAG: VWA domain-containing protein [Myxococcales bacterium]|nr:VWA domain-containing protein [Myxococcales bacterium]MCB9737271.1 VWA domain-containing protein [Deltaproteobacteria bacterium]